MTKKFLLPLMFLITQCILCGYVFNVGYDLGYNEAEDTLTLKYSASTGYLLKRHEQEVLHDILGQYQGHFTDNNSYDYESINRLFK